MSELDELISKRDNISAKISELEALKADKILEAINKQRWYFFKNKPHVLMDKFSGLLWANLDYFPYGTDNNEYEYNSDDAKKFVSTFSADDFTGWRLPLYDELVFMIRDKTFPFKKGNYYRILNFYPWFGSDHSIDLDNLSRKSYSDAYLLPCNSSLVSNNLDYAKNVAPDSKVYSLKERLQFTLDIFVNNNLWPRFNDDTITELYGKLFIDRPKELQKLKAELKEIQEKINELQPQKTLSSDFDYTLMLRNYNVEAINSSLIKYYQSVQNWSDELMNKLDEFEHAKENVIQNFNSINLQLSKKYDDNPALTSDENNLLRERQKFFGERLSLGMNGTKAKILSVKQQADNLEEKIDEIDSGENSLKNLALLDNEPRAKFELVAENTAKIIRNALLKIEYFEKNQNFVVNAIKILTKWTEDYKVFKTSRLSELKNICKDDGIEEDLFMKWYSDWQALRFEIEKKIRPIIERGLKSEFLMIEKNEITIPEQLINSLEEYKNSIDKFYLEERKGIYQKYAFQPGGELQEKFETESSLYKLTSQFQTGLQKIIFNCEKPSDRIYILKWAENLLDIQIDEILNFIADKDLQKISETVLSEFAQLKQKNYDVYLTDAQAYAEEKARREKQYNSLVFKMRKDLAGQ